MNGWEVTRLTSGRKHSRQWEEHDKRPEVMGSGAHLPVKLKWLNSIQRVRRAAGRDVILLFRKTPLEVVRQEESR